ncbi:Histone-lysine N-methyltransferase trithorax [Orchesella cincta]|uniref:Histone-lysine N-methyltransferase trithorax n=1 Tax=Orchesella cincta TaxID=48709 RepID=A0A1D2NG96_ORCCI|nr:Histone-lysine N-methyltransferase trithorax [Orchesella cincta]
MRSTMQLSNLRHEATNLLVALILVMQGLPGCLYLRVFQNQDCHLSLSQRSRNLIIVGDELTLANSFRMLGITHRSVQYLIEQLPGMIKVGDRHTFKYSHRPYVDPDNEDLPAIVNAAGCARSEGFKGRKPFDMFGFLASHHREVSMSCNLPEETLRNQGLPLAMRFRDLRGNWTKARERFVVLHSHIHGRGLYARCDMEKGDIIIEYAGELIRPSLTDLREKYYESRGIGCYMFRINDTEVIDATLKGNAARFINHSCEPNCEAKTVRILGKNHILIFALRKIFKGEELTYDYKFEREEKKIPCSCGASRCRKYMN